MKGNKGLNHRQVRERNMGRGRKWGNNEQRMREPHAGGGGTRRNYVKMKRKGDKKRSIQGRE